MAAKLAAVAALKKRGVGGHLAEQAFVAVDVAGERCAALRARLGRPDRQDASLTRKNGSLARA